MIPPHGAYHASNPYYGHHFARLPAAGVTVAHVVCHASDRAYHQWLAEDAARCGLKIIYDAHEVAFQRVGTTSKYTLRLDWQARCREVEVKVRLSFGKSTAPGATLHSIYLADEPYCHSIPLSAMTQVHSWWQKQGYHTMVVDSHIHAGRQRPRYSYWGFTPYVREPGQPYKTIDRVLWRTLLKQTRCNVLVTQSFQSPASKPIPGQSAQLALAQTPGLVGDQIRLVMRFLWPSIAGQDMRGLESLYSVPGVEPGQLAEKAR